MYVQFVRGPGLDQHGNRERERERDSLRLFGWI
jgi:hypothetical protein